MVAKNLTNFLNDTDKYGQKVGDWALQAGDGLFKCKICLPSKTLSFQQGKKELIKHSESVKHRKHAESNNQQSLFELMKKNMASSVNSDKAQDLEIALVMLFGRHDIPSEFADCLVSTMKTYITDSEIVKKMTLGRTKASYLLNHGIGEVFEKATIEELQNCVAFCAAFDESEVNKGNQLEILVNIANKDGVKTKHYAAIDLESSDAECIANTLKDKFTEDGIDYKAKMIGVSTDGCNTMIGKQKGVIKLLQKEVEQLHHTGSCNGHNLNNTMQHAVEAFDSDMKHAMVDIYQDLGGAKGRGLKKKREFESSCLKRGHQPQPFSKFINVRFRSIRTCLKPVIHNFDEIVHYYADVKKNGKKISDRQKRLIAYFVDREDMTKLKLLYINSVTMHTTKMIDFFEHRGANIHNAADVIEGILVQEMKNILEETEFSNLDFETNEVSNKSRKELIVIDVKKAKKVTRQNMFIGAEATKEIRSMGLSRDSKKLDWFYESVTKYSVTAIEYLQKYFAAPLQSTVMECFSALGQSKQSHVLTAEKLNKLADKYSKVIDNLDSVEGMDIIKNEIKLYQRDQTIKDFD